MSDVNVLVVHADEIAMIVLVWAAVAAAIDYAAWRWGGMKALWWSVGLTLLGPPALLFGALGLVIVAKG